MQKLVWCGLAIAGLSLLPAQNPEVPVVSDLPPATLAGEIPASRVSDPGRQGDRPSIAASQDGSVWTARVEWNNKNADRVLVCRRDPQGNWGAPIEVKDANWDHYSPQIVARGADAMAIRSAPSDGHFDLFAAKIDKSGSVQKLERTPTAIFSDFNARAAAIRIRTRPSITGEDGVRALEAVEAINQSAETAGR